MDCGSVDRAVASNSRSPLFESSHWENLIMNIFSVSCWKDEKLGVKEACEWPNKNFK